MAKRKLQPYLSSTFSNFMSRISNGMYFCDRAPDEKDSPEGLQKHLADMDYITGKISDSEFWSIYQRNKWGRFADKN